MMVFDESEELRKKGYSGVGLCGTKGRLTISKGDKLNHPYNRRGLFVGQIRNGETVCPGIRLNANFKWNTKLLRSYQIECPLRNNIAFALSLVPALQGAFKVL